MSTPPHNELVLNHWAEYYQQEYRSKHGEYRSKKLVIIDMVCGPNWMYGKEIANLIIFEYCGFQSNFCYYKWRGYTSFDWNIDGPTPPTSDNESDNDSEIIMNEI